MLKQFFQIPSLTDWIRKCTTHIIANFVGDRRVELQADRRVPDTAEGNRDNIHNDCWVSLAQI